MTTDRVSLKGRFLRGLGLAGFSLCLTLAGLELAARALHLGSGGFWEPHPLYGWRNIPGAQGWESCYGECAVRVSINSQGLRDREVSYDPPPGTARLLVLGDSMTAGMQVELEETFVKVAEASLPELGLGMWEVVNAAVNGYGTDNALLFYRHEGYRYQPDWVVLSIYLGNDIYDNSRLLAQRGGGAEHKSYFELQDDGSLVLRNFPVEDTSSLSVRVGTFLKKHFQLPRFAAEVLRLRGRVPAALQPVARLLGGARGIQTTEQSGPSAARRGDICDDTYTPEIAQAWAITKGILLELRSEAQQNGAGLAVIVVPVAAQTAPPKEGGEWYCLRANQELASFLEAEGIPYFDMLDAFQQQTQAGGGPYFYARDFHMNAAGHHLAGQLLADFIGSELFPLTPIVSEK
jgi:lysophospholipase L1-like esterase